MAIISRIFAKNSLKHDTKQGAFFRPSECSVPYCPVSCSCVSCLRMRKLELGMSGVRQTLFCNYRTAMVMHVSCFISERFNKWARMCK